MEQLFAVRVLVHYHDKSNVDHAAVRRLLAAAAVDSLTILLANGTSVQLSSYIKTNPNERKPIADVIGSTGTSLTQVASVFMLAEARAAADALPSSPHELETACSSLERLLGCLAMKRPQLPVRDIKQFARVKLGTTARRRALHRLLRSGSSSTEFSLLKAVNAILRLCDVATHCLAVVSRQSVSSKASCETAVAISTRLLTLAASLYEIQKVDATPALSFFSSNSLRTALVAGAMHLGAIAVEHLEIEPMTWIHVANRIVMSNSISPAPKTSVLSALFGGMIKAAKRYESSERDTRAAEGALSLLSTLHVVLETDMVREAPSRDGNEIPGSKEEKMAQRTQTAGNVNPPLAIGTGAVSQAARSFLGERVVSAEEDGDEGRIAARTVYQACEEYAERAGEGDGIMGLLSRLFASAGRQSRSESTDEPVVSISDGTLIGQPDESDASSDGSHLRPDSPPFLIDVFDQRSKDGFGASATAGSTSEAGVDHVDRIELHREIGALALDTLAHWISRPEAFQRYSDLDMTAFCLNLCRSAALFSMGSSSASYELRAAMVDFGSLLGPLLLQDIASLSAEERDARWSALITNLVSSCRKMNPILRGVLSCKYDAIAVKALLDVFLEGYRDDDLVLDQSPDGASRLPVESLLNLLLHHITEENATQVIEVLTETIKKHQENQFCDSSIAYRASCITLLSHAVLVSLGVNDGFENARVLFAALFNRDMENMIDPSYPEEAAEDQAQDFVQPASRCSTEKLSLVVRLLEGVIESADRICFQKAKGSWDSLAAKASLPQDASASQQPNVRLNRTEKMYYHILWSCSLLHKSMSVLSQMSNYTFHGLRPSSRDQSGGPLCAPFVCMKALDSQDFYAYVHRRLEARKQGSITLLYTAECLALSHPQYLSQRDRPKAVSRYGLESLLIHIVRNVRSIASDHTYDDIASNFNALQRSFQKAFALDKREAKPKRHVHCFPVSRGISKEQISAAFLRLGMSYVRSTELLQSANLLGDVMLSAIHILNRLDSQQIGLVRHLAVDIAQVLLFLPDPFLPLAQSMLAFLKQLLRLGFPEIGQDERSIEEAVIFIARFCGFKRVVSFGCSSNAAIHLLCKFARDSSKDDGYDISGLEAFLSRDKLGCQFSKEITDLLGEHSSDTSFNEILSKLLIPADDSAVAVSSHAESILALTEACEASLIWQRTIFRSLSQLVLEDIDDFSIKLVRRSVMQSATLNDAVLRVFDKVIGNESGPEPSRILRKAFAATRELFEKNEDSIVESRVRLLNFAVRLSICDGRLCRSMKEQSRPSLLECEIFELTVDSLETIVSSFRSGTSDSTSKQIILLLCVLLDSFLVGIYGTRSPFFDNSLDRTATPNAKDSKSSLAMDEESRKVDLSTGEQQITSADNSSDVWSALEDSTKSSLCTYTTTGSQFVEQHWYFCYTCELAGSEGVCSVCARVCHDGCELAYSKFSRFFCDCGAGCDPQQENTSNAMSASEDGDGAASNTQDSHIHSVSRRSRKRRPCQCLSSSAVGNSAVHKKTGIATRSTQEASSSKGLDTLIDTKLLNLLISEIKVARDRVRQSGKSGVSSIQHCFESIVKSASRTACLVSAALLLVAGLDCEQIRKEPTCYVQPLQDFQKQVIDSTSTGSFGGIPTATKLAVVTKVHKPGSLDMPRPSGLSNPDYFIESLISFSPGRKVIAASKKSGVIEFIDAREALEHSSGSSAKAAIVDYPATSIPFGVMFLEFHPANGNILLVAGKEKVSILSREVKNGTWRWNQSEIELGLHDYSGSDGRNELLSASWAEGRSTSILVTTSNFIKLFDVSRDVFCPKFFVLCTNPSKEIELPFDQADTGRSSEGPPKPATINGIAFIDRIELSSTASTAFFCILMSDGTLHLSQAGKNEVSTSFVFLCNIADCVKGEVSESPITGLTYHSAESVLAFTFRDGHLLFLSVALRVCGGKAEGAVRWLRLFKDALPAGCRAQLRPIPGAEMSFLFFHQGQTLKASGVMEISSTKTLHIQYFSGSPSAGVRGISAYSSFSIAGLPRIRGGFLALDDGSLHRIDIAHDNPRPQVPEQSILSGIAERQRIRAMRSNHGSNSAYPGNSTVPSSIGFFEKCRLVSDHIAIEASGTERRSDAIYERMAVTLAGGGGDCVVSPKENEPFKFVATVENRAIVLVGARLRFGGTDRSRNRVPAEVKVFGRLVRWKSKNGMKRWLDVPFTVPESTASPQRVPFELTPRRTLRHGRASGDGYAAVDSLELYAVSHIEFTERKLVYENEKLRRYDELRKKQKDVADVVQRAYKSPRVVDDSDEGARSNTNEQAALLTVLNIIDGNFFFAASESTNFLMMINNLWSSTFEGSVSRDSHFLDRLLKPCLRLCRGESDGSEESQIETRAAELITKAWKVSSNNEVESISTCGVPMRMNDIERSLFAVGGIARSLIIAGCSDGKFDSPKWAKCFSESMPNSSVVLILFRAVLSMGVEGRMLLRSSNRAAVNIVDIFLLYAVRHINQRSSSRQDKEHSEMMTMCFVAMMVDLDQKLRLYISQRLIELCDSPAAAAEAAGSPFESILAISYVKEVTGPSFAENATSSAETNVDDANEDADSSQRWAYRCDSCGEVCDQEWWHCTDCDDFDLCTTCLRKPNLSFQNSHNDQHLLLRGTVNEEGSEEDDLSEKEASPALISIQRTVGLVFDRLLMDVTAEEDGRSRWRYLDGAETIVQLVGRKCPVELRATRLKILFESSFPKSFSESCERYGYELDCAIREGTTLTASPRCAHSLFLFLRIILCARGSTAPVHLHSTKIPSALLSLLTSMHRYMEKLSRGVNTGIFVPSSEALSDNLVSSDLWNEPVAGLSYDVLPEKVSLRQCLDMNGMFHSGEEIGDCNSLLLTILASVLDVLEYCFKSAASASISEQMLQFPRYLLCDIINISESTSENLQDSSLFRECSIAATRLLSTLTFDDSEVLHDILDKHMYDEQCRRLKEIAEDPGITAELVFDYDRALEMAGIMANLRKASERHPATWRRFVLGNEGILSHISDAAKAFEGQIRVHALQLLSAGVAVSAEMALRVVKGLSLGDLGVQHINGAESDSQDTGDGNGDLESGNVLNDLLRAAQENKQVSKFVFHGKDGQLLDFLVHEVMLKSQVKAARIAASHVLIAGILRAGKGEHDQSFINLIDGILTAGIELMPFAGELADGFVDCLRFFVLCCQHDLFGMQSESLVTRMALSLTTSLRQRCGLLVSHPNARLYVRLSGSLDIHGYFLESDPCMACSASMCESSEKKECRLDTIRAETKYTDCAIMHRLLSTQEVSAVSVKVIDPRRSRRVKSIDVLYSSRTVSDAAELKSANHPWRKLRTIELGPTSCEACVELLVPVAAANIKLHFVEFHKVPEVSSASRDSQNTDSVSSAGQGRRTNSSSGIVDNLQCPRCSRSVTDRHGICRNCHENAYQCRQCRNINYENLDGFLCNECGYCKHGRFEFSVTGRPTFVAERISNEEDRKRASRIIEKEAGNVHRCMDQLINLRSSMIRSLNSGVPTEEAKDRTRLFAGRGGLADILDSVAPRSEIAVLEALLEQGHASQEIEEAANSTHGGVSVTDDVIAESNGSADPSERDQNNQTGSGLASPANRGRHDQSKLSSIHGGTISKSTTALAGTYSKECRSVFSTMSRGVRVLTLTRAELVRYANSVGGSRLQYANDIANECSVSRTRDFASLRNEEWNSLPGQRTVCYGCTQAFISKCVVILQAMMRKDGPVTSAIQSSDIAKEMILVCSLCERGEVRKNIRDLITYLVNDNLHATQLVCAELARKIEFCIDSFETVDSHSVARFEMSILETTATLDDSCWEERLKLVIRILFKASKNALTCSSVSESIILPCLRVALRLMRVDSELTVIDNASVAEGGSATDAVSNDGVPAQASESSETENEYLDRTNHIALARSTRDGDLSTSDRSIVSGEPPRRMENLEDIRAATGGGNLVVGNAVQTLSENQHLRGTRENIRFDERRQVGLRPGSDVVSGSGAPSSIGTAVDGHLSDDEANISEHRQCGGIDIRAINNTLENYHDSKLLSADVEKWLQGKLDQSSWIAGMKERSKECEQKDKSSMGGESVIQKAHMKTCFERWRNSGRGIEQVRRLATVEASNHHLRKLSIEEDNWVVRLMLFTPCTTVRKEACALLELICGQEETLELQLLDVLTGPALHLGADVGEKSKEFFDLLEATLSSPTHRLYLIAKKFLPRLAALIRSRAERLIMCEANAECSLRLVNFMEGYSLKRLLSLLRQTLEAIPSQRSSLRERLFKVDNYTLIRSLQRAYICVRKLISLRTKLTDDCSSQLCDILLSRDFLFTGSMVTAVVSACVSELTAARKRKDAQAIAILLEQLCLMLCPERKEPICYLSLNKAPTQEEFIRGSMTRNPYPSSSFDGPLMRDVKNKICKDLDLPGLLEDDFAMELLVAGNLVKLDLPIMAVYDHLWRGSTAASMASTMQQTQISRPFGLRRSSHSMSRGNAGSGRQGNIRSAILTFRRVNSDRESFDEDARLDTRADPPMVVIYRLSGLDGEATEPIFDSVPAESSDEQDSEELYGDTVVFGEVGGFDVLFDLLSIVGSWGDDAGTAVRVPALRLLRASCEVARNRTLLAKSPDAVRTLLDCAASAFEHAQGSPTAVISAESLLIAAEQILAQQQKELENHASKTPETVDLSLHDPEEVMSRVQVFLGRLSSITSPKAEHSILHLLPFLIQGVPGAIDIALEYFHFSWDSIDTSDDAQRKAKQLGTVLLATPHDLRGDKFAEQTILAGVGRKAVEYVVAKFPTPRNSHKSQWESSLEYAGPPLVLRLITGLSLFLESRQRQQAARGLLRTIFREENNIIPVLCQLEMAVSGNAIGTTTEELLEAMAKDSDIRSEIDAEREAIKKARREAAKASRMNILREAGLTKLTIASHEMVEQNETRSSTSKDEPTILDFMQDVLDEEGPSCVVCGDGFRCRPEEALCFYVYCRKVPLDLSAGPHAAVGSQSDENGGGLGQGVAGHVELELFSSGRGRGQSGMSSRSGTNSCYTTVTHLNAIHMSCHKEASRADRSSRRDEWDGAFLRNSHTKCNNLFPVIPPIICKVGSSNADQASLKQARGSYSAAVENYFSRLSSLARTSLPNSKAVTYDLGRSLLRFANGSAGVFSEHAKGGGPHSNACLIPSMVSLAIYLLQLSPAGESKSGSHGTDSKNIETQEAALDKFLKEEEVGDITYYIASGLILKPMKTWESYAGLFLGRGLRDGVLKKDLLLRLIAFADLVNRAMKRDMLLGKGEHWLNMLRVHIGSDEKFGQEFGDMVNERWELYIREVHNDETFLKALSQNSEIDDRKNEGDGGDRTRKFVAEMQEYLERSE